VVIGQMSSDANALHPDRSNVIATNLKIVMQRSVRDAQNNGGYATDTTTARIGRMKSIV